LSGKSAIGIASSAISGGGGGMLSFLRYQVMGSALRGMSSGRGERQTGGLSGSPHRRDSGAQAAGSGRDQRSRSRTAGDPSQSAAAQRHAGPSGAFRLKDAGEGFASQRASARYAAAAGGQAGVSPPADARREQARMRATMMRQRAGELRREGDRTGADALSRKARMHDRFARGGAIARPARFSAAERTLRRDTHRQALAEVSGMHALERDALTEQIGADAQRLPMVLRDLALAGATGGDTGALHGEQQAIERRLATNRARVQLITPGDDRQHAPATRAAAAALANERLPQNLRAAPYALRHGNDQASPFVKKIVGAGTQGARDELAHARAGGQDRPDARQSPAADCAGAATKRCRAAPARGDAPVGQ
ncbi:MAG TPA: hypothetical protein VF897_19615, partial [Roseiflexaceae bacterium]